MYLISRVNPGVRRTAGQALLVAVLLMMVILLTGILFVAIVSYNQFQSSRSADVVAAQSLADAGIRWANDNLTKNVEGADWRPPFRAFDPNNVPLDVPAAGASSTWPIPPVMDVDETHGWGVFGLDGIEGTEDDYYSDFERARGWCGRVDYDAESSSGTGAYLTQGFYRLPDVNSTPSAVQAAGILQAGAAAVGGRGHILVRVSYDPDPPFEPEDAPFIDAAGNPIVKQMSGAIKIESIGVVDEEVPVFRSLVAYKPLGLTDYVLFVTDKNGEGRATRLGFDPALDMDGDATTVDWLPQHFYGPMKFNTALELYGANADPGNSVAGTTTKLCVTDEPTLPALEAPGVNPIVPAGGYLRQDRIEASGGIHLVGSATGVGAYGRDSTGAISELGFVNSSGGAFSTYGGRILDGNPGTDVAGYQRACPQQAAPDALTGTGLERYRELTRDSGALVTLATGEQVNLGTLGAGRGIWVDNTTDLQFVAADGTHDLDALMADWMRGFPGGSFSGAGSGWNAMQTSYVAPGVEITLYPTELAALDAAVFGSGAAVLSPIPTTAPNSVWWPLHVAGQPGIRLRRSDRNWRWFDGTTLRDSGLRTLYLDYPTYPNQVIMAEGNVRISGMQPPAMVSGTGQITRDYNLTVASGGTIYIDGQLLSPQDVYGRDAGNGGAPVGAVSDERNPKLALLARDCVCLNATQLAPQATSGAVTVGPDDPANPSADAQHYVLTSEAQGSAYTQYTLGEPLLAGRMMALSVYHTGADPGPAAAQVSVYNGATGTWSPFVFGNADTDGDGTADPVTRFYFAQPGQLPVALDGGPWMDTALSPVWGQLYRTSTGPNALDLPWSIPGLMGSVGTPMAVALGAADLGLSGLGTAATDYWVKKWKLYESVAPAGGGGNDEPTGALHAKINALIYAENGCWFVIPGDYFDGTQVGYMARRFRRYNYDICVRGAITEAFHADPGMVRDWSDKWSWPLAGGGWATIRYEYDEQLRAARWQAATTLTGASGNVRAAASSLVPLPAQANLPKLPLLPVTGQLDFQGEGS